MNPVKAIGFNDFGWSNRADNMQQDLTLAQCKSKFRIFQVGILESQDSSRSKCPGIPESLAGLDGLQKNGTKDNVFQSVIDLEKLSKMLIGAILKEFRYVKYFLLKLVKN